MAQKNLMKYLLLLTVAVLVLQSTVAFAASANNVQADASWPPFITSGSSTSIAITATGGTPPYFAVIFQCPSGGSCTDPSIAAQGSIGEGTGSLSITGPAAGYAYYLLEVTDADSNTYDGNIQLMTVSQGMSVTGSWPSSGTSVVQGQITISGGTAPYTASLLDCQSSSTCATNSQIFAGTITVNGNSAQFPIELQVQGGSPGLTYYAVSVRDSAHHSAEYIQGITIMNSTTTTISNTPTTTIISNPANGVTPGPGSVLGTQFAQNFCGGNSTAGGTATPGVIPSAPVIGTDTSSASTVIGITIAITLAVLLAMAMLYMVGTVAGIEKLKSMMRVEIVEAVATMLLIGLFFGGFFATAFATQAGGGPTLAFGGPGRDVFVSDCSILTNASFSLITPYMAFGTDTWIINAVASSQITIMPGGFGFVISPFGGLKTITDTLGDVQGISATLIVVVGAVVFFLGLIYSLFPLFLYLGVIFRALPWTRAAGGILIAMFIGFYIIFPLMLNATLSDFNHITVSFTSNYTSSNATVGIDHFLNSSNSTATNSTATNFTQTLTQSRTGLGFLSAPNQVLDLLFGYKDGYGILNEYIKVFIEPSLFIAIDVAFAFIVSLDITDLLADILGAPSLSSQRLVGKLL